MSEKKTGLDLLREPFPAHQISKLPKPISKNSEKGRCKECGGWHGLPAVHLDYVGHAALTDRLLDADPGWTWEPLAMAESGLPVMDGMGGMWIKLTVCGVTRLGYGHAGDKAGGDAIKEVIGDALRNAAMRFGAALDLWHKGDLHGESEPDVNTNLSNNKNSDVKRISGRDALKEEYDSLTAERKQIVDAVVNNVIDLFNADDVIGAYEEYSGLTENEDRAGAWFFLPSNIRSAITKHGASLKQKEAT